MIVLKQESYDIIGAALEVHKTIGCGFTEPLYQEALEEEFKLRGIPYEREKEFHVTYKGRILEKTFRPDFVCYNKVIVELKAVAEFTDEHLAQVYNYLRATDMQLGLLINFGKPSLEYKRFPATTKWHQ